MRRSQADERGHQDHAARIGYGRRQRACLGRRLDDAEAVPQPLQRRTGDEDRALERVAEPPVAAPRHRGQHPRARGHHVRAGLEQDERARAIGVLRHPDLRAGLAEQRGLLVAGDSAHRRADARKRVRGAVRDGSARIADLRKVGQRHPEQLPHLLAPSPALDVEQQRARGVGGVGDVIAAAGQPGHQPAVDGPHRRAGGTLHVLHRPARLRGGEVRVENQARDLADAVFMPGLAQALALGGRAPVLPHDGAR